MRLTDTVKKSSAESDMSASTWLCLAGLALVVIGMYLIAGLGLALITMGIILIMLAAAMLAASKSSSTGD